MNKIIHLNKIQLKYKLIWQMLLITLKYYKKLKTKLTLEYKNSLEIKQTMLRLSRWILRSKHIRNKSEKEMNK